MTRRTHSKIQSLQEDLRKAVEELFVAGKTYEEIAAYLADKGLKVHRASVGRWGKAFGARLERLNIAVRQAQAIVREMGERPSTEINEAAEKVATQALLDVLLEMPQEAAGMKLKDVIRAIVNLQDSAVRREKAKIVFARDAEARANKAAEEIDKIGARAKLSPETIAQIREQVYGIVPQK